MGVNMKFLFNLHLNFDHIFHVNIAQTDTKHSHTRDQAGRLKTFSRNLSYFGAACFCVGVRKFHSVLEGKR